MRLGCAAAALGRAAVAAFFAGRFAAGFPVPAGEGFLAAALGAGLVGAAFRAGDFFTVVFLAVGSPVGAAGASGWAGCCGAGSSAVVTGMRVPS